MPFDIRNKCTIGKAPLVKSKKTKTYLHPPESSEETVLVYTNSD